MLLSLNLHDASEERPSKSCNVLLMVSRKNEIVTISDVPYSKVHDAFNTRDTYKETDTAFAETEKDYKYYWIHIAEIEKSLKGLSK